MLLMRTLRQVKLNIFLKVTTCLLYTRCNTWSESYSTLIFGCIVYKHCDTALTEYRTKRIKKKENEENEQSLRKMWDTIKHTNVCVMEIPEREELEKTKYLEETDSLDRLITRDYREISNKK